MAATGIGTLGPVTTSSPGQHFRRLTFGAFFTRQRHHRQPPFPIFNVVTKKFTKTMAPSKMKAPPKMAAPSNRAAPSKMNRALSMQMFNRLPKNGLYYDFWVSPWVFSFSLFFFFSFSFFFFLSFLFLFA